MPELPEVETVARQLAPHLVGRSVRGMTIVDSKLGIAPRVRLAGRAIADVRRSGKRVLIEFTGRGREAPLWLAVHLRMTGRLLWSEGRRPPDRSHLRARLLLEGGSLLFFDTRRFGTFTWYRSKEQTLPDGLDPLSPKLTLDRLAALMRGSRQGLKAWLLRQDRLVGIGNIYASEILHAARLSPVKEAGCLDSAEQRRLLRATRRILLRAIENCGTTFSDYQDARGIEGSYQRFLAVYDRPGRPCRRCRAPIARLVQQQRSTFYCPSCQGPES